MESYNNKIEKNLQIIRFKERRTTHKRILRYFSRLNQVHSAQIIEGIHQYPRIVKHITTPFSPSCVKNQNQELKYLVSLIKAQINQIKVYPSSYYHKVVLKNSLIQQSFSSAKQSFCSEQSIDSKELVKIDILSIFFQQNYYYYKATNDFFDVFSFIELKDFCQVDEGLIKKLYKFYQSQAKYINNHIFPKLTHMILLFSLIKIKFKIHSFIRNHYKNIYNELIQQAEQEEQIAQKNKHEEHQLFSFLFNFCEIFFLAGQKTTKMELENRTQIKQFNTIASQTSLQLQNMMIIKAKIKQKMSFSSIFEILTQLRQNKQKFIKSLLKQDQNYPLHLKFQLNSWQMFLKHHKRKKDVDKGVKYSIKLNQMELRSHLAVAAAMKYQLAKKTTFLQLYLETRHFPLLFIQKFTLSYRKIKRMPTLNVDQKSEDLKATLILISTREKLLTFSFQREYIDELKYFRVLRDLIQSICIKELFVTVLLESRIHTIMNWRQYATFSRFMMIRKGSETYLCPSSLYKTLNVALYTHILCSLSMMEGFLTPQNFYQISECHSLQYLQLVQKRITQYRKCSEIQSTALIMYIWLKKFAFLPFYFLSGGQIFYEGFLFTRIVLAHQSILVVINPLQFINNLQILWLCDFAFEAILHQTRIYREYSRSFFQYSLEVRRSALFLLKETVRVQQDDTS